jgi:hypothetical protein
MEFKAILLAIFILDYTIKIQSRKIQLIEKPRPDWSRLLNTGAIDGLGLFWMDYVV